MDLKCWLFDIKKKKKKNTSECREQSEFGGQQINCSLRGWLRFCGLSGYLLDDLAGVECCKARLIILFYCGESLSSVFAKFDLVHHESLTVC